MHDHASVEELIDAAVDRKIEEQVAQHRLQPGSLPPDAGNLAGLVESLLGQCAGDGLPYTFRSLERTRKKTGKLPPYDLLVRERRDPDGREVKTGVAFVTNVGVSATLALRRLLEGDPSLDHRILVTDQERRPLKVGAQGAEYYRGAGEARTREVRAPQAQLRAICPARRLARSRRHGPVGRPGDRVASREDPPGGRQRGRRLAPPPRPVPPASPAPAPADRRAAAEAEGRRDVALISKSSASASTSWPSSPGGWARRHRRWPRGSSRRCQNRRERPSEVWTQFKAIAGGMHSEGLVHATPHDNDLFLLLRK